MKVNIYYPSFNGIVIRGFKHPVFSCLPIGKGFPANHLCIVLPASKL